MIRSLILYFITPCLILAFVLSFFGINEVGFGNGYYLWIKSVNERFTNWSIAIPKIPEIPYLNEFSSDSSKSVLRVVTTPVVIGGGSKWSGLFSRWTNLVNFFIAVVNGFSAVINILITIVNVVIKLMTFIVSMIYGIKDLPTYLQQYNGVSESLWWFQNVG